MSTPLDLDITKIEFSIETAFAPEKTNCVGSYEGEDVYLELPTPLLSVSESMAFRAAMVAYKIQNPDLAEFCIPEVNIKKILAILEKSVLTVNNSPISFKLMGISQYNYCLSDDQKMLLLIVCNVAILNKSKGVEKKSVDNCQSS
jgi:hypothetical protein